MISFITPSHDTTHLRAVYDSLLAQTNQTWEWVLALNGSVRRGMLDAQIQDDHRVVISDANYLTGLGIGVLKKFAFSKGTGDILAELDHDDLLAPTAVEDLEHAFQLGYDFVFSNAADFFPNGNGHWFPDWHANGWRHRDTTVSGQWYNECLSFPPSAASVSLIYYAPNHIRAWKRDFYHAIGGHDANYEICDDHELLIRTYLSGTMHHIDKCLYLYRMGDNNTFSKKLETIREKTFKLYADNIEKLILREGELKNLGCYDLGGGFNSPPGWISVDLEGAMMGADLTKPWPWPDSSVLAFRAHDILEHLPDKMHTMRELHRCLVPGGWAMIQVPSTDGRGAFQDPTHCSYFNLNSFDYYVEPEQAKYIRNTNEHFMAARLFDFYPSDWHAQKKILYTKAELRAIKGDMTGIPGHRRFPCT